MGLRDRLVGLADQLLSRSEVGPEPSGRRDAGAVDPDPGPDPADAAGMRTPTAKEAAARAAHVATLGQPVRATADPMTARDRDSVRALVEADGPLDATSPAVAPAPTTGFETEASPAPSVTAGGTIDFDDAPLEGGTDAALDFDAASNFAGEEG
jgi:hypothetical protein